MGTRGRIPSIIIQMLIVVTILSMASMGYAKGLAGKRLHFITWSLVLAFSSVMFLIVDLDRPQEGMLKVSQQAMTDLREKLDFFDR